jgi:hypothetical protein
MKTEELVINGTTCVVKGNEVKMAKEHKGMTYCIVRTYSAGVFAGYVDLKKSGLVMEVLQARRLWRWWSEFTLSALAVDGQKKGKEKENKYAMPVEKIILTQVVELIPCSEIAMKQIQDTPNYKE